MIGFNNQNIFNIHINLLEYSLQKYLLLKEGVNSAEYVFVSRMTTTVTYMRSSIQQVH